MHDFRSNSTAEIAEGEKDKAANKLVVIHLYMWDERESMYEYTYTLGHKNAYMFLVYEHAV